MTSRQCKNMGRSNHEAMFGERSRTPTHRASAQRVSFATRRVLVTTLSTCCDARRRLLDREYPSATISLASDLSQHALAISRVHRAFALSPTRRSQHDGETGFMVARPAKLSVNTRGSPVALDVEAIRRDEGDDPFRRSRVAMAPFRKASTASKRRVVRLSQVRVGLSMLRSRAIAFGERNQ